MLWTWIEPNDPPDILKIFMVNGAQVSQGSKNGHLSDEKSSLLPFSGTSVPHVQEMQIGERLKTENLTGKTVLPLY